tara:strand:+ start:143 stop:1888 length:1746 start_codon:yes stop_codon:yes gene_type:complete
MSYWQSTDKIPIKQKSVRIPAQNGVNYTAGQEIQIRIDPGLKFFNPSQTYLECDVLLEPPAFSNASGATLTKPTRLQLDAETGAQSLIRTVRIHDNNGVLLEEIDNYNTLVSVKYDYHSNDSIRGRRALTEGSGAYDVASRGNNGTTKSILSNHKTSPYYKPVSSTTPLSASSASTDYIDARICLPLQTGIMSNEHIFPNVLMGGITITLLLEDNRYCFRQLESVMRFRKLGLNPFFHGIAAGGGSIATVTKQLFCAEVNSQYLDVSQCPFVVGERVDMEQFTTTEELVPWTWAARPEITSIALDSGKIRLNFNASFPVNSAVDPALGWFIFSDSVGASPTYNCKYTVKNVNLIVQEVDAGPQYEAEMTKKMREGGTINYDFLSFTTYKYSQLQTDRVANIRIPIENSRAKSILCVPIDSSPYTNKEILECKDTYKIETEFALQNPTNYRLNSNRPNLEGVVDNLTNYQFLYNQRLQPGRRVDCTKLSSRKSISAQHLIELDKALSQAGITGHSMAKFRNNFVIGRALALGNATYDARNKDFNLMVNYQETAGPAKPHLWCMFVAHIRRIEMKNNSVQLII